jgi:hypothetical protein
MNKALICVYTEKVISNNNIKNTTGWLSLKLSRCSDSLRAGRSGDQIPVWAKFSTPAQTGCEDHPASYTLGIGSTLG